SGSSESISSGGSLLLSPSSSRIDSRSYSSWAGFCGGLGVSMAVVQRARGRSSLNCERRGPLKFDALRIIPALAVGTEILATGVEQFGLLVADLDDAGKTLYMRRQAAAEVDQHALLGAWCVVDAHHHGRQRCLLVQVVRHEAFGLEGPQQLVEFTALRRVATPDKHRHACTP